MKALKITGIVLASVAGAVALLFGVGYLLTIGDYEVAETVAQDPSIPHVEIDGVVYHAETFGDPSNPVVIAIHGGPGGDYRSNLPLRALADDYFVVFFDQRGTGLSPRVDPAEITLESALSDLDSIVDYYGGGRKVNLVGHSWGAMLASGYLGQHPEKVDHAVLAEPGFLTSQLGEQFFQATRIRPSLGILYHLFKTKFEALHVHGPDDQATDDYVSRQMNLYQGADHPQAGYRCAGVLPQEDETWRNGAAVAEAMLKQAYDDEGNLNVSFVDGVESFGNKVLFMTGACQTIIGAEWQRRQMGYFADAALVVISNAGHEMFRDNPDASIAAVRAYLGSPAATQSAAEGPRVALR